MFGTKPDDTYSIKVNIPYLGVSNIHNRKPKYTYGFKGSFGVVEFNKTFIFLYKNIVHDIYQDTSILTYDEIRELYKAVSNLVTHLITDGSCEGSLYCNEARYVITVEKLTYLIELNTNSRFKFDRLGLGETLMVLTDIIKYINEEKQC
jgi:hypothetical protein